MLGFRDQTGVLEFRVELSGCSLWGGGYKDLGFRASGGGRV